MLCDDHHFGEGIMRIKDSSNYILHAKSNQFYWEGNGQLSIKTFKRGSAFYRTNHGFYAVEEDRYLLLNEGRYTISIENNEAVESFCVFFKNGFAEEVARTLDASPDGLLSDPYKYMDSIGFFEKTYQENTILSRQINTFKKQYEFYQDNTLWEEERFYEIMSTILEIHRGTLRDVQSLGAIRYATREETYKRISVAHDFIRAFYNQTISLQEIAEAACLSPNHLLRNYKEIYGKTPHQQITELRLLKAKELLTKPEYNMTDITFDIGFNNPVSFSKMFKQHMGISPKQFRKKVIMDKKYF
jgi:AraC family transcriptional regulator